MKGQTAAMISVVAVVAIIVSGFVPYVVALKVDKTPYTTIETTSIPYSAVQTNTQPVASTYTSVITQSSVSTETIQVFGLGSQTIDCGNWYYQAASLNSGSDVVISFSAANSVYVYVFNSAQYALFKSSQSNTSPNEAEVDNQASGTTSFHVSQTDTYYLVIYVKPGLFGCLGYQPVGFYSASGTATSIVTVPYYVTTTITQVSYNTVTTTVTFYSASSYTTVLTSTTTKTCTLGWLQAAVSSC